MNTVEPLRNKKDIMALKSSLKDKNDKYYIMFIIGINTGLRISDILKLKVKDVLNQDYINIIEQKTGKNKKFLLNKTMKKELKQYIDNNNLNTYDYLIQSRKGDNKPISRIQAYRILNDTAKELNINEIGTHTLRKTFGYWHYKQFHDIALLQEIFNHSAPSITLRYIGINQEDKDRTLEDFFL